MKCQFISRTENAQYPRMG